MRKGFLGIVAALAGAGVAWGQVPPGGPFPAQLREAQGAEFGGPMPYGGGSPVIPPNFTGSSEQYSGIGYPPPANWEQFDPNGSPGTQPGPQAPHIWTSAEYLLGFGKSMPTNYPIATTSAATDQGIVGRGTTAVLFPTHNVTFHQINGFRIMGGLFVDTERRFGFEAGAFVMEKTSNGFFASSDPTTGGPVLARPFIDSTTGNQSSIIVSSPGAAAGAVSATTSSRIWGAEGNALLNFYRSYPTDQWGLSLNGIMGVRFLSLDESLTIASQSTTLNQAGNTNVFNGQTFQDDFTTGILDRYHTYNRFYGGQVGLNAEFRYNRFMVNLTGKLGLGDMHELVQVQGNTILMTSSGNIPAQGGLYAQQPTIGKYQHDTFAFLPEGTVTMGYQFTPWLMGTMGYNVLYLNRVVRPGQLVNGQVDANQLPVSPTFGFPSNPAQQSLFNQSSYWLMTINFGLTFRY